MCAAHTLSAFFRPQAFYKKQVVQQVNVPGLTGAMGILANHVRSASMTS